MTLTRQFGAGRLRGWTSIVCLLLVLAFTALETTHVHSDRGLARDRSTPCVICISAHANAPTVTVTAVPVSVMVELVAVPYEIEANGIADLLDIFIRPPPCA